MSAFYSPLAEFGVQADGHAIQSCGPHTGHLVKNVAYCDGEETAAWLVEASRGGALINALKEVDHRLRRADLFYHETLAALRRDIIEPALAQVSS